HSRLRGGIPLAAGRGALPSAPQGRSDLRRAQGDPDQPARHAVVLGVTAAREGQIVKDIDTSLRTYLGFLVGERVPLRSRQAIILCVGLALISFGYAWSRLAAVTAPLRSAKPPAPLPAPQGDMKFRLPLAKRKEVFADVAAGEPHARAEGVK